MLNKLAERVCQTVHRKHHADTLFLYYMFSRVFVILGYKKTKYAVFHPELNEIFSLFVYVLLLHAGACCYKPRNSWKDSTLMWNVLSVLTKGGSVLYECCTLCTTSAM